MFSHFLIVQMLERLVIDPQFKSVSVLHDGETVLPNMEWEIERSLEGIILVDYLSILSDLFLSAEHAVVQLDGVVSVFQVELPEEQHL